ncbi:MAG: hypothetical protein KBD64_07070 [Gammaproteobacteria bacterium]|nr:hypothetical protein [Gammaproteobacteria bacterium]
MGNSRTEKRRRQRAAKVLTTTATTAAAPAPKPKAKAPAPEATVLAPTAVETPVPAAEAIITAPAVAAHVSTPGFIPTEGYDISATLLNRIFPGRRFSSSVVITSECLRYLLASPYPREQLTGNIAQTSGERRVRVTVLPDEAAATALQPAAAPKEPTTPSTPTYMKVIKIGAIIVGVAVVATAIGVAAYFLAPVIAPVAVIVGAAIATSAVAAKAAIVSAFAATMAFATTTAIPFMAAVAAQALSFFMTHIVAIGCAVAGAVAAAGIGVGVAAVVRACRKETAPTPVDESVVRTKHPRELSPADEGFVSTLFNTSFRPS